MEDSGLKAALHAQTAVVRTIADAAQRDASARDSEALRQQAIEESARLVATMHDLLKHRSQHSPQGPAPESSAAAGGMRRRVLVVEDDDGARSAITAFLAADYAVVTACDGVQGLERASQGDIDAIVSDVRMPNMDGIQMVGEIRRLGGAIIPVILLTAETDAERIAEGFSAGGTTYLGKPVDLDLLAQELRWAIGRESRGET